MTKEELKQKEEYTEIKEKEKSQECDDRRYKWGVNEQFIAILNSLPRPRFVGD